MTRKCTRKCKHCLRGNAQDVDIDPSHVRSLFSQVSFIEILSLSGGEPLLNIDGINAVSSAIENGNTVINNVWICTNAEIYNSRIGKALNRLFSLVGSYEIVYSSDQYHNVNKKVVEILRRDYKAVSNDGGYLSRIYIVDQGRAIGNGLSYKKRYSMSITRKVVYITPNGEELWCGDFYMNVFGDVFNGFDFSYENQTFPLCQVVNLDAYLKGLDL
ncbi:MAG: radical SAM protein [bacterium]|nr:radical SAM protein [bacterium]